MPGKSWTYYHDSIDKICDAYHQAKSKGTGSDNMNEIAETAAGRVETYSEAALQIPVK
jgi:CRISPR/Cas system CMR-associated protein Cmr5 small subunit